MNWRLCNDIHCREFSGGPDFAYCDVHMSDTDYTHYLLEKTRASATAGIDYVETAPRGTKYAALGKEIGALVDTKAVAYGDSFGKSGDVIKILYPDGIPVTAYPDALTIIRILDKLFRIATDRDALGESPYRDLAGYCLLAAARVRGDK